MKLKNSEQFENLTATQFLLIKSCLATSKEERESYVRAWEENVQIEDLEFSSSRLIPYFLHGNQRVGISTIHDNRLKIIYKHWWLRSQHINHQLKIVITALAEAEIKVIVIKGASIQLHYELPELRAMADFDLLVQLNDLYKAMDIIEKLDFVPDRLTKVQLSKNEGLFLDFNHGLPYSHSKTEAHVDLHWRLGSHCSKSITEDLWQNLKPFGSIPFAQKPQLAYEVFLIIIHAVVAKNKDNLNWIIDIDVINKTEDNSFWQEAREIAVREKKEDQFDYGCSILLELGVFAPTPKLIKVPKAIVITRQENRKNMSYLQLSYNRFKNMRYIVNRFYPHSSGLAKLYQFSRYFRYLLSSRKLT